MLRLLNWSAIEHPSHRHSDRAVETPFVGHGVERPFAGTNWSLHNRRMDLTDLCYITPIFIHNLSYVRKW